MDGMNVDVVRQLQEERDRAVAMLESLGYRLGDKPDVVDRRKLIEAFEIELGKAQGWRLECDVFDSNQLEIASQMVADWNKAILLVKGL